MINGEELGVGSWELGDINISMLAKIGLLMLLSTSLLSSLEWGSELTTKMLAWKMVLTIAAFA
ncbi:hypothetical protein [Chamaesiphon polymorphus]|uniref:Uncharacterized protein n=1 Tax=Chamaesiphon polymorphus CCALA 037 TaxID=2107692 RepID=A0A2T1GFK6_9CYAN|nr:hypothetical protein [Chamaesiphon polymorphus]PSB56292.1 hypothetical protein C7B77_12380 [Chamaesiphon polymorphus CCALA 037]